MQNKLMIQKILGSRKVCVAKTNKKNHPKPKITETTKNSQTTIPQLD